MRSLRAARALAAVVGIAIAGCYSPTIMDGTLSCPADGRCPRGFTCRGDKLCYAGASGGAAFDAGAESLANDARLDSGGAGRAAGVPGRKCRHGQGWQRRRWRRCGRECDHR